MKALTLTAYHEFTYGEAPEPEIGPHDVLVAVKACGICGSDIHGMDGSSGRRIPPIIMGHEACGVIVKAGEAVSKWHPEDKVAFDSMLYCGTCPDCLAGRTNLCPERRVIGVSCGDYRRHGAFAEFVALPEHVLIPLPEGLSYEEGAFGEPVAVALHAVARVAPSPGDTAVVVGAGLIGLLVVQALKRAGCARVLAVDLDEGRLALAQELGADGGVNSRAEDALAQIRAWAGGDGADIAMEVVGISPTIQLAVRSVRKGGKVGAVGNLKAMVDFPLQEIVTREIAVIGTCASAGEYEEALHAVAEGSIRVRPLMSAVAGLSEGGEWFRRLYQNDEGLMKVVLRPENA
ncbi:MAG: galactitol-1-phosphate 5-dehydrogenase [Verrucomicrobiales bacterium]|nr:galactitol-1-phosphate 5-dehydrogenase [Verrucomicrobiales bacterium]